MRILIFVLSFMLFFSSISVFAKSMGSDNKACAEIAKACKSAGFEKKEFWKVCMKPVVLGKSVKGVKVDSSVADQCRAYKIQKMKKELADLESVKSNQ